MRKHTLVLLVVQVIALSLVGCEAFYSLIEDNRTPALYLRPEGYVGWVLIEFEVAGAPEVPREEGHLVFEIPTSGVLQFSSSPEYGSAPDKFYYVDTEGKRTELALSLPHTEGMIRGIAFGSYEEAGERRRTYERFFVGCEAEFERAPEMRPEEYLPNSTSESEALQ